jgi:23S rRNA pseudouridine1911/1915/1917 synthase
MGILILPTILLLWATALAQLAFGFIPSATLVRRFEGRAGSSLCQNLDEYENDSDTAILPPGISEGFFVVQQYSIPEDGSCDTMMMNHPLLDKDLVQRLELSPQNMTLPVALLLLDPQEYPSLSRARKACRKGNILVHRGPKDGDAALLFDATTKTTRGRVSDRVFPGDVIGKQVRMSHGSYSSFLSLTAKPSFELPVVYEDDHFAIVHKPAGVLVYEEGGGGTNTIRFALPYVLTPPKQGTLGVFPRPESCHRLDKPTSGLLVVAKTKPAAVHLTRQFEERIIQKTYVALVDGIPKESTDTAMSSSEAHGMGLDVDPNANVAWQMAQTMLEGKEATTAWRSMGHFPSPSAAGQTVTLVELKPKTGRYHQLRRTMAWMYDCPIIGDTTYGTIASKNPKEKRWRRGLMLCSNRITLQHPYFNTESGREEWSQLEDRTKYQKGALQMSKDDKVLVSVSIDAPYKFGKFLEGEEKRARFVEE